MLFALLPGTIRRDTTLIAELFRSSRIPPLCFVGPWQLTQFWRSNGCTSCA
jgi:hypothetical protein